MSIYNDDSNDYLDSLADARWEKAHDGFEKFCKDHDYDPVEDYEEAWDAFQDYKLYNEDPYKYYGVRRSDF